MSTTSQQQQPQHGRRRVFKQPRQPPSLRSEQRPPSRRTTSTRGPDDSNEHNNNVRNEEIDNDVIEPRPETIRPTPDQFRAATRTSTRWTTQFDFCFLLVVLSIFLSKPSWHHKTFVTRDRTPAKKHFFLSISCTQTFHLIWFDLSKGRQIEVTTSFQQLEKT